MPSASALLARFKTIKTLPTVAIRLTQMISDDSYSMKAFESVIKVDPTLTLKLLKMVNSPYYALMTKVTSIAEAVAYVGMDNLRNLIVMDILKNILAKSGDSDLFSRNTLWLHCAAVAVCSQMISERIFQKNGENAFLCGLIHDVGIIVEDQLEPASFVKMCRAYAQSPGQVVGIEREYLGTDHTRVGSLLARDWKLPLEVVEGIRSHHTQMGGVAPDDIKGMIQVADYLVCRHGISPFSGAEGSLSQPLIRHIKERIRDYKTIVLDLPEELAKAEELYVLEGA